MASLPLECMSQPQYNWVKPQQLADQVNELWNRGLPQDKFIDDLAVLVEEHMLDMYPATGTILVGDPTFPVKTTQNGERMPVNPLIPVSSVDELWKHHLKLTGHLSSGSYGDVFYCSFWDNETDQRARRSRQIVKFMGANLIDKEGEVNTFLNEVFLQSILHCVMNQYRNAQDSILATGLPNPIPPIIAPLNIFDGLGMSGLFAAVMPDSGRPFIQYIWNQLVTAPSQLFLALIILSAHLRDLQDAAKFQHCDLHANNVLIYQAMAPYRVKLSVNGQLKSFSTFMQVSIIDFGNVCIDLDNMELSTMFNEDDDIFGAQCREDNRASDLFIFLCSIVRSTSRNVVPKHAQQFVDWVRSFVDETIDDAEIELPHVSSWTADYPPLADVYRKSIGATLTTPEITIERCLEYVDLRPITVHRDSLPLHIMQPRK